MSKLGDELVRSMAQALAHAQGRKSDVRTRKVAIAPDDVQKARKRLGLSQDQFADAFGVSASTLRKWEQGQRSPTGAARTLMKIIEREPRAVMRALEADSRSHKDMNKPIKYTRGPIDSVHVVADFLPPPHELASRAGRDAARLARANRGEVGPNSAW